LLLTLLHLLLEGVIRPTVYQIVLCVINSVISVYIVPCYTLIILVTAATKIKKTLVKDDLLPPKFMPNFYNLEGKGFSNAFSSATDVTVV